MLLAQTILLAISVVIAGWTVWTGARANREAATARQNEARARESEARQRLARDLEARYATLVERIADFERTRRRSTLLGGSEYVPSDLVQVEQLRVLAALHATGGNFPAAERLAMTEPSQLGADDAGAALGEVGGALSVLAKASLHSIEEAAGD